MAKEARLGTGKARLRSVLATGKGRRRLVLAVSAALLIAAVLVPSASAEHGDLGANDDVIALTVRGSAFNETPSELGHFVFTIPVFSGETGKRVGTVKHDVRCSPDTPPPPCLVLDMTRTYHLPGGDIVDHAPESNAADPQRPGFLMTTERPESTANSDLTGSGVFANRTGRVRFSGLHDLRQFPSIVTFDDLVVIEFTPRS